MARHTYTRYAALPTQDADLVATAASVAWRGAAGIAPCPASVQRSRAEPARVSYARTHARTHALRLTSRRGSTIAGNGGTEGSGLPLVFRVGSHLVLRCWPRNPGHGVRCPQGEHDVHFRATKFVPTKQQTRAGARPSDHCENSGGMSQRELSEPKANDGPSTVRESKYGEKFSINCALTPADTPRCCACSHARAHASRP